MFASLSNSISTDTQEATASSSSSTSSDVAVSDNVKQPALFSISENNEVTPIQLSTGNSYTGQQDFVWPIDGQVVATWYYLSDETINGHNMSDLEVVNCDIYWNNLSHSGVDHRASNGLSPLVYYINSSGSQISADITTGSVRNLQHGLINSQYGNNSVFNPKANFDNYSNAYAMYVGEIASFDQSKVEVGDRFAFLGVQCQLRVRSTGQTFLDGLDMSDDPLTLRAGQPSNGSSSSNTTTATGIAEQITIHRYYAPSLGTHFYTDKTEAMSRFPEYEHEGAAYKAFKNNPTNDPDIVPVYQFYNGKTRAHLWTVDEAQRDRIIDSPTLADFQYEGPKYYAYAKDATAASAVNNYRFYNPSTGAHFFTAKQKEYDSVISRFSDIFDFEGVAYKVLPA